MFYYTHDYINNGCARYKVPAIDTMSSNLVVYIYMCVYVCECECIYVYMYMCICIYSVTLLICNLVIPLHAIPEGEHQGETLVTICFVVISTMHVITDDVIIIATSTIVLHVGVAFVHVDVYTLLYPFADDLKQYINVLFYISKFLINYIYIL